MLARAPRPLGYTAQTPQSHISEKKNIGEQNVQEGLNVVVNPIAKRQASTMNIVVSGTIVATGK
jgi:hypothetical protein